MSEPRTYRCFYDGDIASGGSIILTAEEARHLASVRRMREGRVEVVNGAGALAGARIIACARQDVRLEVQEVQREPPPDANQGIGLALSLIRHEPFEDAFRHAIELGITHFWPVQADRSVIHLDSSRLEHRIDRWRRLAIESIKQCERLWLPCIHPPLPLAGCLMAAAAAGMQPVALVERTAGAAPSLGGRLAAAPVSSHCLFIGPEGGWSPEEAGLLEAQAVATAHLGPNILRAETAAIASVATVLAHRLSSSPN